MLLISISLPPLDRSLCLVEEATLFFNLYSCMESHIKKDIRESQMYDQVVHRLLTFKLEANSSISCTVLIRIFFYPS